MYKHLITGVLTLVLAGCGAATNPPSALGSPSASLPASTEIATLTANFIGVPERLATTPFPMVALPAHPAADFAFSFSYGPCPVTRVLSTFDNTLSQSAQPNSNAPFVTATLTLSAAERDAIYQRMRRINLFGYPKTYTIPVPKNDIRVITMPYSRYEFLVQNDTVRTNITWNDEISRPTTTEADNLRDLITFLQTLIEARPEMQQLPSPIGGCA